MPPKPKLDRIAKLASELAVAGMKDGAFQTFTALEYVAYCKDVATGILEDADDDE